MTLSLPFLVLHIAAGFAALLAGLVAMLSRKGGVTHIRAGIVFYWSMVTAGATACVLASLRPNVFLFLIGVMTLYLVHAGRRAVAPGEPDWRDHGAAVAMLVAGTAMVGLGALGSAGLDLLPLPAGLAIVLVVFGGISMALAAADLRDFRRDLQWPDKVARHLQRMTGAYIATSTAFVVVNATFLPPLVRWLGPTALLVPVIFWFTARLRRTGTA
ncbi:MAG: hypothetical protein KIT36_01645 [Alphaproteobacteria bacterium]|nr:hypothetical protein [Alphaproteobacteria bacterium]